MQTSAEIQDSWNAARLDNLTELERRVPERVSPNAKNIHDKNQCHTLLMAACAHGSVNCAKYLIQHGANVNLKNFNGFTALHWAAFTGRTEAVQLLLEHHADIESRTKDGKSPLHIAAYRGHRGFIDFLLSKGADLNTVDAEGLNCLHMAGIGNQAATVEFLLQRGIDVSQKDAQGRTFAQFCEGSSLGWLCQKIEQKKSTI